MSWRYEVDEKHKWKHHWDRLIPGFVFLGHDDVPVGKCPSDMTSEQAEKLLNEGIPFFPEGWKASHPKRIYVVHDGAVYRAAETNPGSSYHGFPETGAELRHLPSSIRNAILKKAQELGCEVKVQRWMNQNP